MNSDQQFHLDGIQRQQNCCVPEPLLTIKNLTVRYGQLSVLADINMTIPRGCITALIGPSGCGKTTLLSTINRLSDLYPDCHVGGEIHLNDENLLTPTIDLLTLRRRIGMIFQRPNPFPLSIFRNLDLPLREHGVSSRHEREQRIEQALRDVGLWDEVGDRLNSPALRLSGGQQQRLCIARALVIKPEVLLMDEPCSALDPTSSAVVEALIQRLAGRYTVIIVTHNLAQARRIAHYTGFFWTRNNVGSLIEFAPSLDLFERPVHSLTAAYVHGHQG